MLSGAVKHALRMELIFRDPVALVSPPTVVKTEAYSPEMDEVLALLSLAEKAEDPLWPFIHLIAFTGMRRGEALALTWEHIDLDEGTLQICQSLVVTADGVSLEPPKTARGERTVALDALTVGVLRKHRAQQEELAGQLGVEPPAIVFPRREWTGWSHPNTVMHAVQRLAKRAGCPSVTLRSLRHFHASVLLDVRPNYARGGRTSWPFKSQNHHGYLRPRPRGMATGSGGCLCECHAASSLKNAGQMLDKFTTTDIASPYEARRFE